MRRKILLEEYKHLSQVNLKYTLIMSQKNKDSASLDETVANTLIHETARPFLVSGENSHRKKRAIVDATRYKCMPPPLWTD